MNKDEAIRVAILEARIRDMELRLREAYLLIEKLGTMDSERADVIHIAKLWCEQNKPK